MDLHDRSIRMNEAEMSLFSPFRPMLAERKHINEASKSIFCCVVLYINDLITLYFNCICYNLCVSVK